MAREKRQNWGERKREEKIEPTASAVDWEAKAGAWTCFYHGPIWQKWSLRIRFLNVENKVLGITKGTNNIEIQLLKY